MSSSLGPGWSPTAHVAAPCARLWNSDFAGATRLCEALLADPAAWRAHQASNSSSSSSSSSSQEEDGDNVDGGIASSVASSAASAAAASASSGSATAGSASDLPTAVAGAHPRAALHAAEVALLEGWVTGSLAAKRRHLALLGRAEQLTSRAQKLKDPELFALAAAAWHRPAAAAEQEAEEAGDASAEKSSKKSQAKKSQAKKSQAKKSQAKPMAWADAPAELRTRVLATARADLAVCAADALLFRALTQVQMSERLRGLYNMRKAWKAYEAIANSAGIDIASTPASSSAANDGADDDDDGKGEENDEEEEGDVDGEIKDCVRFGAGLFYFIISLVPPSVTKVVQFIGFVGDRVKGLSLLQRVCRNGGVRTPFAAVVLLLNYLMIPRAFDDTSNFLRDAETVLDQMDALYPRASPFAWLRSHWHRKHGNVSQAVESVQRAISTVQDTLGTEPRNFMFDLGCCRFMQRDWEGAAEVFEALTSDEVAEFELKGMSNLQLASCYAMMDRNAEALDTLALMPKRASASSRFDKVALAKAERCCSAGAVNPFLGFEILYLRRDLAHLGAKDLRPIVRQIDEIAGELDLLRPEDRTDQPELEDDEDEEEEKEEDDGSGSDDDDEDGEDDAAAGAAAAAGGSDADATAEKPKSQKKKTGGKKEKKSDGKTKKGKADKSLWSADTAALRATYHLIRGTAMIGLGNRDAARSSFESVIALEGSIKHEKYLLPFAMYELAELSFKSGDVHGADLLLNRARKFSGYDWEETLSNRIRLAQRTVQQKAHDHSHKHRERGKRE